MSPVAVVTGSAQGIGRRIAETLAARGYALALLDLRASTETASAVQAAGAESLDAIGDLTDEAFVAACAADVLARWGRVDVLVNNAGISCIHAAEHTSPDRVSPRARSESDRAVSPRQGIWHPHAHRALGSIVNIASVAGLVGISERAAYNASKHGLIGLTRTLAAEWGPRGVRTNAVCPGWVKTDMDATDQASGHYSDVDITSRIPMGRFAYPEDVASAVAFLADPRQSGFINGAAITVDGGWTSDGSWQRLRDSQGR